VPKVVEQPPKPRTPAGVKQSQKDAQAVAALEKALEELNQDIVKRKNEVNTLNTMKLAEASKNHEIVRWINKWIPTYTGQNWGEVIFKIDGRKRDANEKPGNFQKGMQAYIHEKEDAIKEKMSQHKKMKSELVAAVAAANAVPSRGKSIVGKYEHLEDQRIQDQRALAQDMLKREDELKVLNHMHVEEARNKDAIVRWVHDWLPTYTGHDWGDVVFKIDGKRQDVNNIDKPGVFEAGFEAYKNHKAKTIATRKKQMLMGSKVEFTSANPNIGEYLDADEQEELHDKYGDAAHGAESMAEIKADYGSAVAETSPFWVPIALAAAGANSIWHELDVSNEIAEEERKLERNDPNDITEDDVMTSMDEEGIRNAYAAGEDGTYYDRRTLTLYMRGSMVWVDDEDGQGQHLVMDWPDNALTIPFWGDTRNHNLYQKLKAAYLRLERAGMPVRRLVGHSAGASAVLELEQQLLRHGVRIHTRTFGGPILAPMPRSVFGGIFGPAPDRIRSAGDPVSFFDYSSYVNNASFADLLKAHSASNNAQILGDVDLSIPPLPSEQSSFSRQRQAAYSPEFLTNSYLPNTRHFE
jgi:hypothetical protein